MHLPAERGPASRAVLGLLVDGADADPTGALEVARTAVATPGLDDEDVQLALWTCYQLAYGGFEEVEDDREWDLDVLAVRRVLETGLERDLREATADLLTATGASGPGLPVADALFDLVERHAGPPVARYVLRQATAEQVREMLVHRSLYQLQEADPHSWLIPRLHGAPKVALTSIQFDEYGAGEPRRQHARLFADAMGACGLATDFGHYVDAVGAPTLALGNAMSLLCLNRRLRGAGAGHLAALEATSSLPSRKVVGGVDRLGLPVEVRTYYDEHIEADAVHEQVAARDLCEALVAQEPHLRDDVLFGAAVCLVTESALGTHLLDHWRDGRSSLRGQALPAAELGRAS